MRLVAFRCKGDLRNTWLIPDNPDEPCTIKEIAKNTHIVIGGSCVYSQNPDIEPILYYYPNAYILKDGDLIFAASSFKVVLKNNIKENYLEVFKTTSPNTTFTCQSDDDPNNIIVYAHNGYAVLKASYLSTISSENIERVSSPSVVRDFF